MSAAVAEHLSRLETEVNELRLAVAVLLEKVETRFDDVERFVAPSAVAAVRSRAHIESIFRRTTSGKNREDEPFEIAQSDAKAFELHEGQVPEELHEMQIRIRNQVGREGTQCQKT